MQIEPNINHAALLARLREQYGIAADKLSFVPKGEVSIAYVVHDRDSNRYFAKLLPDNRLGLEIRASLDTYPAITYELSQRKVVRGMVAPLPTRDGSLYTSFGTMPLLLFPYIAGVNLPYDTANWPDAVCNQIARALGALHQASAQLRAPLLSAGSAFDLSFIDAMERGMAALAAIGSQHRPGQQALRALLLPLSDEVKAFTAQLRNLHTYASRAAAPLVLCHTDIHGGNLLLDERGDVYIIDWENLTLAPPEHDLQAMHEGRFADFLAAYWEAGGVRQLDTNQFAFYYLRRYLGDMADWLLRILYENNEAEQDEYDLAGIEKHCIAKWRQLDKDIANIAALLGLFVALYI